MDIMDVAALKAEICRRIAEHELNTVETSVAVAQIPPALWREFRRKFSEHFQLELAGMSSWLPLNLKSTDQLQAWQKSDEYKSLVRETVGRVLRDLEHLGGPTLDDFADR